MRIVELQTPVVPKLTVLSLMYCWDQASTLVTTFQNAPSFTCPLNCVNKAYVCTSLTCTHDTQHKYTNIHTYTHIQTNTKAHTQCHSYMVHDNLLSVVLLSSGVELSKVVHERPHAWRKVKHPVHQLTEWDFA